MTAEISVMNRTGVALAADSAVTTSFLKNIYDATDPNPKIYNSNKLFMLSKYHPIGIMIYGNASLIGVPWEIIIKNYRKSALQNRSFDYVEDYARHFLDYLGGSDLHFPEETQENYVHGVILKSIEDILQAISDNSVDDEDEELEDKELQSAFLKEASEHLTNLESLDDLNDFNITEKEFFDKYEPVLARALNAVGKGFKDIGNRFHLMAKIKRKLRRIVYLTVVKDTFKSNDRTSGIVISGYGEKEIYPALVSYEVEAVVDNKAKYLLKSDMKVGREANAFITPFAQGEMVKTFMEGVVPDYKIQVNKYLSMLLLSYPDVVLEKVEAKVKIPQKTRECLVKQLREFGSESLKEFADEMQRWIRENNANQILSAVEALPIEELASMAETLVSLTSFKRRVTPDLETVGGPVDVAVISKGDGFVWIKRKHYFEKDKNPHFFANYYS
jgi:hypothetical protein